LLIAWCQRLQRWWLEQAGGRRASKCAPKMIKTNSLKYSFCPGGIALAPHRRLLLLFIFYLFSLPSVRIIKLKKGGVALALRCCVGAASEVDCCCIFNLFSLPVRIKNV